MTPINPTLRILKIILDKTPKVWYNITIDYNRGVSLHKSVPIGGLEFKIEVVPLEDDHGDSSEDKQLIRIDDRADEALRYKILFHEAVHMALRVGGIAYGLDGDDKKSEAMEESIVRCIENLLYPLILEGTFLPPKRNGKKKSQ